MTNQEIKITVCYNQQRGLISKEEVDLSIERWVELEEAGRMRECISGGGEKNL